MGELEQSFFKVGDRVVFNKPDGDGHFSTKDEPGTVEAVYGPKDVQVRWDDDDPNEFTGSYHDDELDLI